MDGFTSGKPGRCSDVFGAMDSSPVTGDENVLDESRIIRPVDSIHPDGMYDRIHIHDALAMSSLIQFLAQWAAISVAFHKFSRLGLHGRRSWRLNDVS